MSSDKWWPSCLGPNVLRHLKFSGHWSLCLKANPGKLHIIHPKVSALFGLCPPITDGFPTQRTTMFMSWRHHFWLWAAWVRRFSGHHDESFQGPFYWHGHYGDVIMSTVPSQITSLSIVYSTLLVRRRSKKTSKLHVTGLCVVNSPVTAEFSAQMASNAENVSIWWGHHDNLNLNREK